MGSRNRYDGIDPTIIQSVRAHAQRLSRSNALPGMEIEDIEQEFVLHVLRRSQDFDPSRASFPTFIDRIVRRHAVAMTETVQTLKRGFGIDIIPFADLQRDPGTSAEPPRERTHQLPIAWGGADPAPEDEAMLRHDISRLIATLPDNLWQCCLWILEDSISAACRRTGLARSSAYERIATLRERCRDADLEIYLGGARTVSMSFR